MSYSTKVGSFNIDTAKTVGQTQAITGLGFQPKIVLFFWSGSTATEDTVAGGTFSFGFGAAVSSSSRFYISCTSEDAQGTSDAAASSAGTSCVYIRTDTSTINGILDFSSMDADGFTLVVDDQFTQAYRISYVALGGSDLTDVYIGTKATPTSTGNFSTTGVGFRPDALIFAYAATRITLGWATGASNQGVVGALSIDNLATTDTAGYGYNAECSVSLGSTSALSRRESFVSLDSDGFTLNHLEGVSSITLYFIALKGGQYSVGDLTTRTDGNDIAEDVGFQPATVLFASANRALSTQDTPSNHARLSIGAATSTSNRAVAAMSDEDNLADSETAYANYDSAVYAFVQDDASVGLMDIKSIDASGFTAVMDDADPAGCWVTYLAIGAVAVAPSDNKRSSMLQLLLPFTRTLAWSTGSIAQAARQHLMSLYSGILAESGVTGQPYIFRLFGIPTMGRRDRPGGWN